MINFENHQNATTEVPSQLLKNLGRTFAAYRWQIPLSQEELSARSGEPLHTIVELEQGLLDIDLLKLLGLLKAMHVTSEDFFQSLENRLRTWPS